MKSIYSLVMKGCLLVAACLSLAIFSSTPACALSLGVEPANIPITFFYHGQKLTISGTSASNDDLIIKISSPAADVAMKYKEKVGGLVWMKKGSYEFKDVPAVYLLHSTAALDRILSPEEQQRNLLGYKALIAHAKAEDSNGKEVDKKWLDQFIHFKEAEKVYNVQEGTVVRQHGNDGNTFTLSVDWPFQAPPGTYNIEVMAVRDGIVVDSSSTSFTVERQGITATLSKMAFDKAAIYGIMAIAIALVAGFAVGALFKGGGSH
jgi:uncharacterized protein (TIGR02186 family)